MRQTLELKKGDVIEIGEERDILMEQLKALQQRFNEEITKSDKGSKTIKVPHKDLKLAKSARKSADNSTWLHSDSFKISTEKSQEGNIDSGGSSQKHSR